MLFYLSAKWLHLFLELVKVCSHITMEMDFTLFIHTAAMLQSKKLNHELNEFCRISRIKKYIIKNNFSAPLREKSLRSLR